MLSVSKQVAKRQHFVSKIQITTTNKPKLEETNTPQTTRNPMIFMIYIPMA